jgi:hypothetical protein
MATTATISDFRRADLRTNALENPFWISSAVVDASVTSGLKDKACLLFSFPVASQKIIIWDIACQVISDFTALTTLKVGYGTIATDDITTAGTMTYAGATTDSFMTNANFTAITAAWYFPAAANTWLTARAAGTHVEAANLLTGAASTVPCITLTMGTATVITGKVQVHLQIAVVPGT